MIYAEIELFQIEYFEHLTMCKQMTDVILLLLHSNTGKHLKVCKKTMSSGSFKNVINKMYL